MAVKIRLKRMGKIRAPFYRVVVMDSRTKRDGRAIEEIGKYHPTLEPSLIEIHSARAGYWLGVGAQPTEQVLALLKITGDWQKHKGLPGAEGTLKVAPPKPDRRALYEAAMAVAGRADEEHSRHGGARKRTAPVAEAAVPAAAQADDAAGRVEAPEVEPPKAESPKAEAPEAGEPAEAAASTVDQPADEA